MDDDFDVAGVPGAFFAKAALDRGQLERKVELGCDGIEYQLRLSDFSSDMRTLARRRDKEELVREFPASVVHPPLGMSGMDVICDPCCGNAILEESMRLAEMSAGASGRRCLVVVHVVQSRSDTGPRELADMTSGLERLLAAFPSVDIVLENLSMFRGVQSGLPEFCNGYYDANVRFAEYWGMFGGNGEGGRRVMTCLDVCHAVLSAMYLDALSAVYERGGQGGIPLRYSLRDYLEMNAGMLGLVHLAGVSGNGYDKGHGTPFRLGAAGDELSGQNMGLLDEFMRIYGELGLTAPATLEVREDDYTVSDGYASSIEAVRWYLSRRSDKI